MMQINSLYEDKDTTYWEVHWFTVNTGGGITADVMMNRTVLKLNYTFRDISHDEQVNYLYDPPGTWDFSNSELFGAEIYGDNSNHTITVYLQSEDFRDSYWFEFNLNWEGWRKIVYPISDMNVYGNLNISAVNKIEIVINDNPDSSGDGLTHSFYVGEIFTISYTDSVAHEYSVELPNPEKVVINMDRPAKGVLFREYYFENWDAYLTDGNGVMHTLNIYRSGPDFMYVHIPDDTGFPVEVIIEYKTSEIELFSYLITILTSAFLVLYMIGMPLDRLIARMIKKIRSLKGRYAA